MRGPVNVAGPGHGVADADAAAHAPRLAADPAPAVRDDRGGLARARGVQLSDDTIRYLRYGRGVDIRRLIEDVRLHARPHDGRGDRAVASAVRGGAAPSGPAAVPAQAQAEAAVR